ncbi:MAG: UDP-N-acetylmuramoyl-tripeptide--D-alanyl-D-alanine ligase [Proteobacteria bacterium]|nr:UDP-N-acetylmuramoyl-tripeptide--D-alanyl-D-alanine ligase [Pseudomonadota bacterium]
MSMQLLLSEISKVIACPLPKLDAVVTGMVIDSRKVETGNLFIALAGEHVDGHDYLAEARSAGASAALVSQLQDDDLPQLLVKDVVSAFGQIAAHWRQQCAVKVVAITGSNGKTTVKEMLASILGQNGKVLATQGNLNNELGVPLTLARLDKNDDYAVIEMGASQMGDIASLVAIAQPDIALINNVAPAHLEGFGDVDGVAKAKGEIFADLGPDGIGIINTDMPYVDNWKQVLADKKVISFALENDADITAQDIQLDTASSHFMVELGKQFHYINLPLTGLHNVANALAAISVSDALNIPASAMEKGLAAMKGVPHRLQLRAGLNQSQLVDDTYNANPASYKQALASLQTFSGEHWLVLGDFGELGSESKQLHQQMGEDAKQAGIQRLFAIGENSQFAAQSFGEGAVHFEDMKQLQQQLQQELTREITCLIKGSRFMQLDKLADVLADGGEG